MSKFGAVVIAIICVLVILIPIYFGATPIGKAQWNTWFHIVQKADDDTNYETLKKLKILAVQ